MVKKDDENINDHVDFSLGNEAILRYKDLDYKIWYALAEFVDNSSQNYLDNRKILDDLYAKSGDRFTVHITTDRENSIEITDNAMGMNYENLNNALHVGKPPSDNTGRHEFGMGLKTASCWLGDVWTIKTKKVGDLEELEVVFDVNKVARGQSRIEIVKRMHPENERNLGFTSLKITKLHNPIAPRTQTKIIDYLTSMYRVDIRESTMDLKWNGVSMKYEAESELLKAHNGEIYRKEIKPFEVDGKKVTGWIGILGSGGVNKGGLAIIRRGRCIVAHPEAWKPRGLYGTSNEGQNNLISQRLFGEIVLDDFRASHTKNAIRFYGTDEEQIEQNLVEQFAAYKAIAGTPYKKLKEDAVIKQAQKEAAQSKLEKPSVASFIAFEPVPSDQVVKDNKQATLADIIQFTPDLTLRFNDELDVEIYTDVTKSPNDEYVLFEYPSDNKIIVVVNNRHPYYDNAIGDDPVVNHLVSAAADALAEWKCRKQGGEIKPDTIRLIKDQILRMVMRAD
jgi:hypothetical protein